MCHFQVSSHCWCVSIFVIGCWQITGSHSCCQAPNPAMGPLYRLLMLLPSPESLMGPCTGLPFAAVSIATLCHVPLSGLLTQLVYSIFC
ncbi:unnamed protein product, partial [Staurois parvus]